MPRLFTGLEIPAEIGQTLSNLRGGLPGARWIDPENYHVTLRFIGDIDGVAANEIAQTLERINRKPFEVSLQGLSSFGGKKPRAVVASVVPSRPLMELQAELERICSASASTPKDASSSRTLPWRDFATRRTATSPTICRCAAISRPAASWPRASCCSPLAPPPAAGPMWSRIRIR